MMSTGICRWLFLLVSLATWIALTNSTEMRVVCYYTNWSVYRPGDAKFSPQNINPYLCTHLIYAFGGFTKENTLKPFDKYQDVEKGGYAKFTGLKTYNKNLKTLLAIGGWNEGSTRFSPMVANPERRKEFAKNAIKFLRLNHFDGLDLDWEYPSFRDGGKPRDKDNYPLLVQDLREEFEREAAKTGRPKLLLTMAVPAGLEYINKGFNVPELTKYLDWMNILSYDYHSAFEPSVNHHAPLYSLEEESEYNYDSDLNIDHSIKHYLKNGADPSKLVLGIPTYGRSYTLLNPDAFDIGSPADGPGTMGDATRENGYLAYYEICDYVKNQDWEVEQPNSKVMGPYAFKDNQWVGYDDEEIVKRKAEYVAKNGLGGIMFWSIDNDDFRGKCHGKAYPLIEAGRAALLAAYGVTDDNLIAPPTKPLKSRTRTRTKTLNKVESSDQEKPEKPEKQQTRRRNRVRPTKEKQEVDEEVTSRRKTRRKDSKESSNDETSSYSSLKLVTPSYTTPASPNAPEMDGGFKCEEDGFFPNPKDCKKYYWCLSGAGDSGIIAHSFTCPAGLYFNKASDSCDYTQNVVCNKKMQKTAKIQDSISSSTLSPLVFSTARVPPKITAATSRTTFRQTTTTTTEAYEDEEDEYEDEENEDAKKESEEDPRVIKELIELIKKAGGIEELEKQFKVKGESASNPEQATTKSSIIPKSLYERVLSKAIKNTSTSNLNNRNSYFRNSRGPQSEKTEAEEEKTQAKADRGKLQYTSISRFRASSAREKKNETENESDQVIEQNTETQASRKITDRFPSYTNIRRARTSTTSAPENDRNKILGEVPDDDTDDDEEDDDDDVDTNNEFVFTTKKTNTPHYVNIRRQRPSSTTEETSTSSYLEIKRGSTSESKSNEEETHTTSKYKQIRRGTTTTSRPVGEETHSSLSSARNEETTVPSTSESGLGRSTTAANSTNKTTGDNRNEYLPNVITTTGTYITTTDDINLINFENNESKSTEKPNLPTKSNFLNSIQRKRPQLFEPRPFTKPTEASSSGPTTTQATKVSYDFSSESDNYKVTKDKPSVHFRSRGASRFNSKKTINTADVEEDGDKKLIPSRRRLIVTEKYIEEHRTYRPSELADLSSLTAVDFDNIKDLNSRPNHRRRRPLKPSTATTTTTTTTTEKPEDLTKSQFPVKRRRVYTNFNDSERLRELSRNAPTTESNSPRDSLQSTSRNRKVIRRFRTSASPSVSTLEIVETTTPIHRNRISVRPTKSILDVPPSNNEVDDDTFDDSSTEEDENIKLSESNIRESSDLNNFGPDTKLRNKFSKSGELYGKSSVHDKTFVGEKSTFTFEEKSSTVDVDFSSKNSTEPTVFNRTRKIIRKIIPTQSSVPTQSSKIVDKSELDSDQIFGRKRKIIRKLRPVTKYTSQNSTNVSLIVGDSHFNGTDESILKEDTTEIKPGERNYSDSTSESGNAEGVSTTPKRIFRHKLGGRRFTPPTVEPEVTTPKYAQRNKTVLLRGPSRNYRPRFSTKSAETDVSTESSARSQKYSFIPRRTTKIITSSAATSESTTDHSENVTTESQQLLEDTDTTTLQDQVDYLSTKEITFTTDEDKNEYTTTDNFYRISEAATTEADDSTEQIFNTEENDINSEINTKYTEIPPTTLNADFETTTTKLNKTNESDFTTIYIEQTTAIPTEITTILTNYSEVPTTATIEKSSAPYRPSILKSIDSRPKYIPSKLKGLSNSRTTEEAVLKPKANYRNRFQSSTTIDPVTKSTTEKDTSDKNTTKDNKRFNKYRAGFRNEKTKGDDSVAIVESSSPSPINKSLYKYRKPKPQEFHIVPDIDYSEDIEDIDEISESSSALPINKSLYKYRKPKPQEIQKITKVNNDEYFEEIDDVVESSSTLPINKSLYKYIKPRPQGTKDGKDIEETDEVVEEIKTENDKYKYLFNKSTSTLRPSNKPYYQKTQNKSPSFSKSTTEEPKVNEELQDIDTEAVKNRNKNIFNSRKSNASSLFTPSTSPSTVATEETTDSASTVAIDESTTYFDDETTYSSTQQPTSESSESTTLVHIFAEKAEVVDSTTEGLDKGNQTTTTTNRVERLIEINRIVNVKSTEDIVKNHHVEHITDVESPILDKVGAINRVTVIKVVDKDGKLVSNNETKDGVTLSPVYVSDSQTTESPIKSSVDMIIQIAKIEEIPSANVLGKVNLTNVSVEISSPNPSGREERRFDIVGNKLDDNKIQNIGQAEIFGGLSHINVITPRPIQLTESSTIALEGLFQTEKPSLFTSKNSINDELLETDNSKFVNVRVLHPVEGYRVNKEIKQDTKVIPIKILKQDEEDFIMSAKVVEVSTKSHFNTIRIVPIKVEAAKRIPPPLPLIRINREHN